MSFNFRHNAEEQSCPINWAISVPVHVSIEAIPMPQAPRSLSTQELASLIYELGQEGSLNQQQIRILSQLPELAQTIAAE